MTVVMAKRANSNKRKDVPMTASVVRAEIEKLPVFRNWKGVLQVVVIAAAVLTIFWPVLHGDWLWDDDADVSDNIVIKSSTGLWSIWFVPGSQLDYYPIKASVQWVQWHLWGMDTLGYHLTNILLHIVDSLLVWRLLSKLNLKFAWLGGLLFAIHPANVESVAWIAELKNTLSQIPFLLAMIAWIDFDKNGKRQDYLLSLAWFLVAMLCKTTMALFPVVILLYAWWRRGRIGWGDAKASVPFFAVSLILGVVTLVCGIWFVQAHQQILPPAWAGGIASRLALAAASLTFYFCKCFWPVGLLPIYPKWNFDSPSLIDFLPWLIAAGVAAACWVKRRTWGRHVLLGLGFFCIMLAPFLGFKTVGYMDFTWVMDHFLYIPMIGLLGLALAGAEILDARLPRSNRPFTIGLVVILLALFGFGSWSYAGDFINQETLWTYTTQANPDAWLAHNNLGKALLARGESDRARVEFEVALRLRPDYPEAHNNLGDILLNTGQFPAAMEQFQMAVKSNPNYAVPVDTNMGVALLAHGQTSEAIEKLEAALKLAPHFSPALYNLASALEKAGRLPEAVDRYREAIQDNPSYAAEGHNNIGKILTQLGKPQEAINELGEALKANPNLPMAYYNLGNVYIELRQMNDAATQYREALRISPNFSDAHDNLGVALAQMGRTAEAIAEMKLALQFDPNNEKARANLAVLQAPPKKVPAKK
jgi:Tfp pilus assembly protein PilF